MFALKEGPAGASRRCHGPTYAGSSYISEKVRSAWKGMVNDD